MSETIKMLCYKSKTLSNGEHPLMLCVCKDRKRQFQSLGISIKAELWDFKTNQPKDKCPNRERIAVWKIQCKLPPKTKRFCPLVLK